jgi:hypothetical protein
MKRQTRKLNLHRETLRTLDAENLPAAGGLRPTNGNSQEISICLSCTKRLDGCPDPTATIG